MVLYGKPFWRGQKGYEENKKGPETAGVSGSSAGTVPALAGKQLERN